jgi:hypothetical protein
LLTIYKELGLQTIPIALAKGQVNAQKAREMEALLSVQTTTKSGGEKQ